MPDYLRMDLGDLVRHLRGKKTPHPREEALQPLWLQESSSQEAHLRVVPSATGVEFFSLLTGEPLFSLPSPIVGPPVKSTESAERGQRQVVMSLPLEGGKTVRITYQSPPEVEPSQVETTRASQARVPPESSLVEFLLTREEHEFRYVFEFPDNLPVQGFRPVEDRRPVFRTIPPVAQMAAFLRAMTQHRRSTLAALEDMAQRTGSDPVCRQVSLLGQRFPRNHEFVTPNLRSLEQALKRGGRIVHPAVLAAVALLVEFWQGGLQAEQLDPARPLELSPRACWRVARHFGVEPPPGEWHEHFGEAPDYPDDEALSAALKRSSTSRTHLDILGDLGREAKSQRAAAFVEALREQLPSGQFRVNDEQVALGALLAANGIPVHGNTLTALCLFVDVEVGVLTPLAYDKLASSGDRVDTSMYAMVAVAGAFDLGLRGFALEHASERGLTSLLQLAGGRLMARFLKPNVEGYWWEYLSSPGEVPRVVSEGLGFTGHVLGKFALIDQLNERDLRVFMQAGQPLMACFSADYDRTVLWKKLEPGEAGESFTFIKRFTAFSFNRMVMAELAQGRPAEPAILGELDARGNYQFRYLADPGELPEGWTGKRVVFPTVDELPELMYELGQDPLLGRSETLLEEARTLELIHASVGKVLRERPTYAALDERPSLLERLQEVARGPGVAGLTAAMIDAPTREGLLELIARPGYADLDVYEPLARAVDTQEELEFLALHLLFSLCTAEDIELERRYKQYDEPRLRQLLRTRLHGLLDSPEEHTRALAARLLVTQEEIRDRNDRLIAHYELNRARQDESALVQAAAGEGLAQLALDSVVPLPEVIRVRRRAPAPAEPAPAPEPTTPSDQEVVTMSETIRAWAAEKIALPQSDSRQARANRLLEDEALLQGLARFLVSLNRALEPDRHSYLALLEPARLRSMRGAVLDSWKVFALSQGHRLGELAASRPASELRLEYGEFLLEHGLELARKLGGEAPFLGGPAGPVTLYHLQPNERAGTSRRLDSSFLEERREDSPLFLALTERLDELPRLLRVERADGIPLVELERNLAAFTTERLIEPALGQVFQPRRARFAPFLHRLGLQSEQLDDDRDLEDFEALLGLLQQSSVPAVEEPSPAEPSLETVAPEPAGPSFRELVLSLSQAFDLPRQHQKQVINILLDIGFQSVYDL